MAPGTHTGAASPVAAVGAFPVSLDETMKSKILNDVTAYSAQLRHRAGTKRRAGGNRGYRRKGLYRQEALDGKLST